MKKIAPSKIWRYGLGFVLVGLLILGAAAYLLVGKSSTQTAEASPSLKGTMESAPADGAGSVRKPARRQLAAKPNHPPPEAIAAVNSPASLAVSEKPSATPEPELPQAVEEENALYRLAATEPASAVQLAKEKGASVPSGVLENLVHQWANKDLAAALSWVGQSTHGDERERLLGRIAYVLSETEPTVAAAFVAGQMNEGPLQNQAALSVIHQWATRDFNAAKSWVASFPTGPLREQAERELAGLAGAQ